MSYLPAALLSELAANPAPQPDGFHDTVAMAPWLQNGAEPAAAWRSEAFAEDLPPAPPALNRAAPRASAAKPWRQRLQRTKVLSWMMGSRTASTMVMTTPPMPTMSKGSSTVASAIARR